MVDVPDGEGDTTSVTSPVAFEHLLNTPADGVPGDENGEEGEGLEDEAVAEEGRRHRSSSVMAVTAAVRLARESLSRMKLRGISPLVGTHKVVTPGGLSTHCTMFSA